MDTVKLSKRLTRKQKIKYCETEIAKRENQKMKFVKDGNEWLCDYVDVEIRGFELVKRELEEGN
jgi:hypothetical protein